MAMVMGLATITWHAQHTVAGITLNMFALGFTSFWYRVAFGVTTAPPKADLPGSATQMIPLLSKIPFIRAGALRPELPVLRLARSRGGGLLRYFQDKAGPQDPRRGRIPPARRRRWAWTWPGSATFPWRYAARWRGWAGHSSPSSRSTASWTTSPRAGGFIALAIVIFGKWNPWLALVGSLFFGVIDALQLRLQAIGLNVPYHIMLMLPYALTIVVMVITAGKSESPAALGQDYEREVL